MAFKLRRIKWRYFILCLTILLCYIFRPFTHLFEKDFFSEFKYPYEGDIDLSVRQLRNGDTPEIPPINSYDFNILLNPAKCSPKDNIRIVLLIKSAVGHFERREIIRNTWGFERRFSDVEIRTVFLIGVNDDIHYFKFIDTEYELYKDLVQINFYDSYYNNTIKTMMGFKWAVENCPQSKFYMFVDDDYYVSMKNVLRFLRNPANYPRYLSEPLAGLKNKLLRTKRDINLNNSFDISKTDFDRSKGSRSNNSNGFHSDKPNGFSLNKTNDFYLNTSKLEENYNIDQPIKQSRYKRQSLIELVRLYAGHVIVSSPHRHLSSKWYVSLDEYPYHMWPPYVTAGAYILSNEALFEMYYTSFYTKHFRFDDIYLGLLAYKALIEPFHCEEFYFHKKKIVPGAYKFTIASHGFDNPAEMATLWQQMKSLGDA